MNLPQETTDLLALRALPELAGALRQSASRVAERWTQAVEKHLPDADPLTAKQVRNSIPTVLEKIALALESGEPEALLVLEEVSAAHGAARFQQKYNVDELLIEYRLLRRVIFDELYAASGDKLTFMDAVPVDMGVDTALHRGVRNYVRHLKEELEATAVAESRYLSFLSHDLRNHLNSVTLMLEMVEQNLNSSGQFPEIVEDMQHLRRSVHQTVGGMDRLLQAERLRKQVVTIKLAPVNLHGLAEDVLAQARNSEAARAPQKALHLISEVPPDAAAQSDRELLILVLQNLVGNAVKFTERGTVRIAARSDKLGWRVEVIDEGPGIAPEQVASLFGAFSRGETHGKPGVGLGLNIASHAARLLGSELTVQSTVGKGSTFSFTVPPARPQEAI
ncbi:MAG TPA: sensor histidine kinase [Tepidisphaeraceae bacterium]|jgi:signal transduction histidine kinase